MIAIWHDCPQKIDPYPILRFEISLTISQLIVIDLTDQVGSLARLVHCLDRFTASIGSLISSLISSSIAQVIGYQVIGYQVIGYQVIG